MPRRPIDKKDQRSQVVRFELGNFERQQLEKVAIGNMAGNLALPVGIGIAGLAVGFGIFLAYKSLDDLKDFAKNQWDNPLGMNTDNQERLQSSVTNTPIMADSANTANMPAELEGLSAYASYDLVWNSWDDIYGRNYVGWCAANNLPQNHETLNYFRENARGFLHRTDYRVDNDVGEDEWEHQYSQFAYQMAIRETAWLRQHGYSAINIVPWLGGAAWDFFAGLNPASGGATWTSRDARDAPGYVLDPLLDIAWGRSLIDGNQGHKPIPELALDLENWILTHTSITEFQENYWPLNSP